MFLIYSPCLLYVLTSSRHWPAVLAVVTLLNSFAQASVVNCPGCASLWGLQPILSGKKFDDLNHASGHNHTELVLVTSDTTANLPIAQLQFQHDTLISGEGESSPSLFLGSLPQQLLLRKGVILTVQNLSLNNVFATFTNDRENNKSADGSSAAASWSLSLDSFSLSPGSLLRLVSSRVVLVDCRVSEQLFQAAAAAQAAAVNVTQYMEPDVYITSWRSTQLEITDVLLTCNEVCSPSSGGVRTLRAATPSALWTALQLVNDPQDGCSAHVLELSENLSIAEAIIAGSSSSRSSNIVSGVGVLEESRAARRLHRARGSGRWRKAGLDYRADAGGLHGGSGAGSRPSPQWLSALGRRLMADEGSGFGVQVKVNLTLRGVAGASSTSSSPPVVLDAALLRSVFRLHPPATLTLERLTLVNLVSPQPGVLALPVYMVDAASQALPRVALRNVTMVLSRDEVAYEGTWLQSYSDTASWPLSSDLGTWLRQMVLEAQIVSTSLDSLSLRRLRFLDIDAVDLQITSKPPAGFRLSQPSIGISLFSVRPYDRYPQIVVLNSSEALVSVLNTSEGGLTSRTGAYEAYPGVTTLAAVSLLARVDGNGTAVFAPVPYGRVVLQRSYVVGPHLNASTGRLAAGAAPPVLDLGRTRSPWAVWGSVGLSLTLRNVTVVGLDSRGRWPVGRLALCLDLPLWALDAPRQAPLSASLDLDGEQPPLRLTGATVSISPQELKIWAACNEVLSSNASISTSLTGVSTAVTSSAELWSACRGLELQSLSTSWSGPHALTVQLMGLGMQLQDVVLRDDIIPYQRYDLGELLLAPAVSLDVGYPSSTGSIGISHSKWVIPVSVVGLATLLTTVLLCAVYIRKQWNRGSPGPYVNVHMMKMIAENTLRPYTAVTQGSAESLARRLDSGAAGSAGTLPSTAVMMESRAVGSNRPLHRGSSSRARSSRIGEANSDALTVAAGAGERLGTAGTHNAAVTRNSSGTRGPPEQQQPESSGLPDPAGQWDGDAAATAGPGEGNGEREAFSPAFSTPSADEALHTVPWPQLAGYPHDACPATAMIQGWNGYGWPAAGHFQCKQYGGHGMMVRAECYGNMNDNCVGWTYAMPQLWNMGAFGTAYTPPWGAVYGAESGLPLSEVVTAAAAAESCALPEDAADAVRQVAVMPLVQAQTAATAHAAELSGVRAADAVATPLLNTKSGSRTSRTSFQRQQEYQQQSAEGLLGAAIGYKAAKHGSGSTLEASHAATPASCSPKPYRLDASSSSQRTAALVPISPVLAAFARDSCSGGAFLGDGLVTRQATAPLLTRSVSVERAARYSPSPASLIMSMRTLSSAAEKPEVEEAGSSKPAGGDRRGSSFDVAAAAGTASDSGFKPIRKHQHLLRTASAASALMSMFKAESRIWPQSPDRPSNHHHSSANETLSNSPSSSSPSARPRRRANRATQPQSGGATVSGSGTASTTAAEVFNRLNSGRGPSATELSVMSVTLDGSPLGASSLTERHSIPEAAAASPKDNRAVDDSSGNGNSIGSGSGPSTLMPPPQLVNASAAAGALEPDVGGYGVPGTAPLPTAPKPRRKSPFLVRTSAAIRQPEAVIGGQSESSRHPTPVKLERRPSAGGYLGSAGSGAAASTPAASGPASLLGRTATAGGSLVGSGNSAVLQMTFSEPVRATRVTAASQLTQDAPSGNPSPPPLPTAKSGLGRLLVGSLSNLFRVDSLVAGALREPHSPLSPPLLNRFGSGNLSGMNRQMLAAPAGAARGEDSRSVAVAAGTGSGATAAPGGGRASGSSGGLSSHPSAALNELMASMESRLNENQLVIQQVLGSGAFGTVYRALWKGLQVAVKTLTLTSDAVTQGRHAGLMEAALSKSIFHTNVVTTYTCDLKPVHVDSRKGGAMTGLQILNETEAIQEWRLYIVQEYCDGGSLRHAIEARSFLNPSTGAPQMEWVLQMAREVAAGLQYLHEHSIIHGDLNPANILLRRDDNAMLGYSAKIADFGLSVHMHAEQSHVSNTKRGTPFYTAPEVTNAGNLTRFADVFSYGVVLWELYCSRSCWMYGPSGRLVHQRSFPHLPPSCPRPYAQLVANCMQPAHKQRPNFKQIGLAIEAMGRGFGYAAATVTAAGGKGSDSTGVSMQEAPMVHNRPIRNQPLGDPSSLQPPSPLHISSRYKSPPPPQLFPHHLQQRSPSTPPVQQLSTASKHSSSAGSSSAGARSPVSTSSPISTTQPALSPPLHQLPPALPLSPAPIYLWPSQQSAPSQPLPALLPQQQPLQQQQQQQHVERRHTLSRDASATTISVSAMAIGRTGQVESRYDSGRVMSIAGLRSTLGDGPSPSLVLSFSSGGFCEAAAYSSVEVGGGSGGVVAASPQGVAAADQLHCTSTPTPSISPAALTTPSPSTASSVFQWADSSGGGAPWTRHSVAAARDPSTGHHPTVTLALASDGAAGTTRSHSAPIAKLVESAGGDDCVAMKIQDGTQEGGTGFGQALPSARLGTDTAVPVPVPNPRASAAETAGGTVPLPICQPHPQPCPREFDVDKHARNARSPHGDSAGGGSDISSGGGCNMSDVTTSSSALAGLMRAFEIPVEAPRFAPPDLPTVPEVEDEPLLSSGMSLTHGSPSISTALDFPLSPRPVGEERPADAAPYMDTHFGEGGPSIGDHISAGVAGDDTGTTAAAAAASKSSTMLHAAPSHRRRSCPLDDTQSLEEGGIEGSNPVEPCRFRSQTAPGFMAAEAAGGCAHVLQNESSPMTLLGLVTACPGNDDIMSPRMLTSMVGSRGKAAAAEAGLEQVPTVQVDSFAVDAAPKVLRSASGSIPSAKGGDSDTSTDATPVLPVPKTQIDGDNDSGQGAGPSQATTLHWHETRTVAPALDNTAVCAPLETSIQQPTDGAAAGAGAAAGTPPDIPRVSVGAMGYAIKASTLAGSDEVGRPILEGLVTWVNRVDRPIVMGFGRRSAGPLRQRQPPSFSRFSQEARAGSGSSSVSGSTGLAAGSVGASPTPPQQKRQQGPATAAAVVGMSALQRTAPGTSAFARPSLGSLASLASANAVPSNAARVLPISTGLATAAVVPPWLPPPRAAAAEAAGTVPSFSRVTFTAQPLDISMEVVTPETAIEKGVSTAALTGRMALCPVPYPFASPFMRPSLSVAPLAAQTVTRSLPSQAPGGVSPHASGSFVRPSLGAFAGFELNPTSGTSLERLDSGLLICPSVSGAEHSPVPVQEVLGSSPGATGTLQQTPASCSFARASVQSSKAGNVAQMKAAAIPNQPQLVTEALWDSAALPRPLADLDASPFVRPSVGLQWGSEWSSQSPVMPFPPPPPEGAATSAAPSRSSFCRPSLSSSSSKSGFSPAETAVALPRMVASTSLAAAHFCRSSLGASHGRVRSDAAPSQRLSQQPPLLPQQQQLHGGEWYLGEAKVGGVLASAASARMGSLFARPSVSAQAIPGDGHVPPVSPFARPSLGSAGPIGNSGPLVPLLLGPSLPALPLGFETSTAARMGLHIMTREDAPHSLGGGLAIAAGSRESSHPSDGAATASQPPTAASATVVMTQNTPASSSDRASAGKASASLELTVRHLEVAPHRVLSLQSLVGTINNESIGMPQMPPTSLSPQPKQSQQLQEDSKDELRPQLPHPVAALEEASRHPELSGKDVVEAASLRQTHERQLPGRLSHSALAGDSGGVFGSPVFMTLGSSISGTVTPMPTPLTSIATRFGRPSIANQAPVGSYGSAASDMTATHAQLPTGTCVTKGPFHPPPTVPVPLPCAKLYGLKISGNGLSRSLDSNMFIKSAHVQTTVPNSYANKYGPRSSRIGSRDAPPNPTADVAIGTVGAAGGIAGAYRSPRSLVGPYSHGQLGSLPRSYIAQYPAGSGPRSAAGTSGGPNPSVGSPSTRTPPKFQRDSLRTLEAAAVGDGNVTGQARSDAILNGNSSGQPVGRDVRVPPQSQQPHVVGKAPWRNGGGGGMLKALRSAVETGATRRHTVAEAAQPLSDPERDWDSSDAEGSSGGRRCIEPPTFSRRGVSFGIGVGSDDEFNEFCSDHRDGGHQSGDRTGDGASGGVVWDLLAAGSLMAALSLSQRHPAPPAASGSSATTSVLLPQPDTTPLFSSSAPSMLNPAMLVGSPVSVRPVLSTATPAGIPPFGSRFSRSAMSAGSGHAVDPTNAFSINATLHGDSFDEVLRLAKSSLSTVPESGTSLSQASMARSSQGSEHLKLGAGRDQAAPPPFDRIAQHNFGRGSTHSCEAVGALDVDGSGSTAR